MTDRERRLREENAGFEKPKEREETQADAPERVTDMVDRKKTMQPERSQAPTYEEDESIIDVDKQGIAHKRDSDDAHPTPPPAKGPTVGGGYRDSTSADVLGGPLPDDGSDDLEEAADDGPIEDQPPSASETGSWETGRNEADSLHDGIVPDDDEDIDETTAGGLRYPDERPLKGEKS